MINNQSKKYSAIILAAGQGSRFGYKHKALIKIKQKTLLEYWIEQLISLRVHQIIITDLKGRIQNTKKIIQQKFNNYLNHIQYVEFEYAPGPGLTLMKSLLAVNNQYSFLISCDTFSNIKLSDLYFNESICSGKILVQKNKQGYFSIIKKQLQNICCQLIKEQQDKPVDKYVYAGLFCFKSKDLLSCFDHPSSQAKSPVELKQILFKMTRKFSIQALKLQQTKYYFENINSENDYQRVVRILEEIDS